MDDFFFQNINVAFGRVLVRCLLAMLENWKQGVNKSQAFGSLLADLSKGFHSLPHELLIETQLNLV